MRLAVRWCRRVVVIAAVMAAPAVPAAEVDHRLWDELTEQHVADGRVDYEGMAKDRQKLSAYVVSLREADPSKLPSTQAQLAFWINAYNALVVKAVLDHQPLKSVKDIKGFFDRLTYRLAGRDLTLDKIEEAGRALGDWRIHFALVRACAGGAPLRPEAYTAEWMDAQLAEQMTAYLQDRTHGLRVEGNTLWLSPIFKWSAKDVVQGKMVPGRLLPVLEPYLSAAAREATKGKALTLKYLNYDWSLNAQQPS